MPSKKFIIVLIILLAGAGIFWLIKSEKQEGGNKTGLQGQKDSAANIFQQNKKDSDNDGLADWEEVLWKTDSNNQDTDGDGTLDGEEVKLGRDPLKKGPNDLYSSGDFSKNQITGIEEEPLSETEKFSRDFISQYLNYKLTNGGTLDQASKDKLVDSLLMGINSDVLLPPYTLADLKISPDNNQQSLKNYASQLEEVFFRYVNPPPAMEIYIFKDMAEKKDESMAKELDKSVATYEGLRKDSLALTVPSELKSQHLKLVNNLALLKGISEKLRDYFKDPLGAVLALKQYGSVGTDFANSIIEIRTYLKSKDVGFKF